MFGQLENNVSSLSATYNDGLKRLESLKQQYESLWIRSGSNNYLEIDNRNCARNFEEEALQENTLGHTKCLLTFASFFSTTENKPNIKRLINELIVYLSKQKEDRVEDHLFDSWEKKIQSVMQEVVSIDIEDGGKADLRQKIPQPYTSKYLLNKTLNATVETLLFGEVVPKTKEPTSQSSRNYNGNLDEE